MNASRQGDQDGQEPQDIVGSLVPLPRSDARLILEAGYLWMDLGQPEKAKETFLGAAALMPRSEVPQIALGSLHLAAGAYDKALTAFRAAQKLAPKSALPRAHAGEALLFMGKAPQALKELDAACKLEPDSDGARFAEALRASYETGAFASPGADASKASTSNKTK